MTNYTDDIFKFPHEGYYVSLRESRGDIVGTIQLPEGIVEVDLHMGDGHGITRMEFVFRDRVRRRTWGRFYSCRYLVTLAKRFVEEIYRGKL